MFVCCFEVFGLFCFVYSSNIRYTCGIYLHRKSIFKRFWGRSQMSSVTPGILVWELWCLVRFSSVGFFFSLAEVPPVLYGRQAGI